MFVMFYKIFIVCFFLILKVFCKELENNDKVDIKVIWKPQVCKRFVEKGDFVRYHYYGMHTDGKVFDTSYQRAKTYDTYVGSGWLIPGMDDGLLGTCVNEHRLISIPPSLAYGEDGTDDIPGNSTLLFNFVLVDIWNSKDDVKITTTYMPETCERKLEDSDYVRYHYNGTLLNGKVFHTSYEEDSTYNTYVGQGWLIKGMDVGLVGACFGERRTIEIPPHLGYGEKGDGKNIPASATIVFDIEIIDFHNPKDEPQIKIVVEVEGCERKLESSDFVRYHYNGSFADGSLFDSSYQRNKTYDTYVGFKRVIPGMELGLVGSCMGERRVIKLPPHLGYGEPGIEGRIPGSAVLIFSVHIVDFHNPKDDVEIKVESMPPSCLEDGVVVARKGNYLTYDYKLLLMDGTFIESSTDSTGDWGNYLGRGELIPGVERGLTGMCVGEIRRVVVPPHIGYGEQGRDSLNIPGSAVLVYTFHLHKIQESLPEGFTFVWSKEYSPQSKEEVFAAMDEDKDEQVSLPEMTSFILDQVERGHAHLLPGHAPEKVITDLFKTQDIDHDEALTIEEFRLKMPDALGEKVGDEL
nr:peptidyl-prolyl cis-trans isomerase FKBP9 [Ciona intestinalis]|eukprot:XP_009859535.1 peptidyl-prolyl cis-trans isomerase FKBP9 [Ciona intestinalis]